MEFFLAIYQLYRVFPKLFPEPISPEDQNLGTGAPGQRGMAPHSLQLGRPTGHKTGMKLGASRVSPRREGGLALTVTGTAGSVPGIRKGLGCHILRGVHEPPHGCFGI